MAAWIEHLSDEDLAFLKRFILASGSLKDLASAYGISYPTVRLRLDRVIDKIKQLDNPDSQSEFERLLRLQYADGKIDAGTFKTLLTAHRKEMETSRHDQSIASVHPVASRDHSPGHVRGRDAAGDSFERVKAE